MEQSCFRIVNSLFPGVGLQRFDVKSSLFGLSLGISEKLILSILFEPIHKYTCNRGFIAFITELNIRHLFFNTFMEQIFYLKYFNMEIFYKIGKANEAYN